MDPKAFFLEKWNYGSSLSLLREKVKVESLTPPEALGQVTRAVQRRREHSRKTGELDPQGYHPEATTV